MVRTPKEGRHFWFFRSFMALPLGVITWTVSAIYWPAAEPPSTPTGTSPVKVTR
jgi:hypothetical protein